MGMAVRQQFGHLGRDAARGVRLRHDHGSCFLAEDFQRQIRAWGVTPSYAFVGEPATNGVVERFFRTLKEQIVHGRVHETIEDVRDAVRDFIARYNAEWLVEKNGSLSPFALRRQHELAAMPAHSTASGRRFHGHPATRSTLIRPPPSEGLRGGFSLWGFPPRVNGAVVSVRAPNPTHGICVARMVSR